MLSYLYFWDILRDALVSIQASSGSHNRAPQTRQLTDTYPLPVLEAVIQDPGVSSSWGFACQLVNTASSLCPHVVLPLCMSASWSPLSVRTSVIWNRDSPHDALYLTTSTKTYLQIESHSELLGSGHHYVNLGVWVDTIQAIKGNENTFYVIIT